MSDDNDRKMMDSFLEHVWEGYINLWREYVKLHADQCLLRGMLKAIAMSKQPILDWEDRLKGCRELPEYSKKIASGEQVILLAEQKKREDRAVLDLISRMPLDDLPN